MQESTKCQGLMTVTNKHLVYAPLHDTAFTPNKRWRLNTINKIQVSDKNSLSFETEDENICFEMEKPNKVVKLVKKQKKKIIEKERKSASVNEQSKSRRTSLETILGSVVLQPNKITRRNTSVDRSENRIISTPCRRTMALPPEPTENPYYNMRGRNMGRSNTHLEPLCESKSSNTFMRHQSLPPRDTKDSYEPTHSLPLEENFVYSSGMSSSEDDFTDMKSMESLINERKNRLEKFKKSPTPGFSRTQSVCEALDGDYVDLTRDIGQRSSVSFDAQDYVYDNLPNTGLFANGIGPFERMPILDENCQYAALDIKESRVNKIHRNEEASNYMSIDFVATYALEKAKQSLHSVC